MAKAWFNWAGSGCPSDKGGGGSADVADASRDVSFNGRRVEVGHIPMKAVGIKLCHHPRRKTNMEAENCISGKEEHLKQMFVFGGCIPWGCLSLLNSTSQQLKLKGKGMTYKISDDACDH